MSNTSSSHDWFPGVPTGVIADRVTQFRDPRDASQPLPPSFALVQQPRPTPGRATTVAPEFVIEGHGHTKKRLIRIRIEPGTSLYGCGEAAGPLRREGRKITCYNADTWDYTDLTPGLYQSQPFVLAVRADGTAVGILCDTTCKQEMDLTSTDWRTNSAGHEPCVCFRIDDAGTPPVALYIIERGSPMEVVQALAELTGKTPMPPLWSLGYHQCRWSYEPADRVRQLARDFRAKSIPCDVIWHDIDYMDGFRCFTFDRAKFPDPKALNDELHAQGFKTVWMIDPGIKHDPNYAVYQEGHAGGHFLQTIYGDEYHGSVWPGPCAFPDFTMASTRTWWAGLYKSYMATGIDGVWNDMNEPAIFDTDTKQMPADNWHRADVELGGPDQHRRYHNVYGMLMVRASREGIQAANPTKRPFVLTRSNFIGGQRYAATWTGDNRSDWNSLYWSITMALNMGVSGQPFVGPDIGGFVADATPALFARWMGIGALLPFARGHSIKDSKDHEPWSFGPDCEATCRRALTRRYRLLPYLYTLFREAHTTGLPVVRPVFTIDPKDPALRSCDDAFLLGGDLLIRCRVTPEGQCHTPRPAGWQPWDFTPTSDGSSDPELPELSWRPGSIVPMGPAMQFTSEKPLDPLTLVVTLDVTGKATGTLYEDAGDGHGHERGEFRLTAWTATRSGNTITITSSRSAGSLPAATRPIEVVVVGQGAARTATGTEGTPLTIAL